MPTSTPLRLEVTYLPAESGVQQWLEHRPASVAADLAAIRGLGFGAVRLHLAWDAFMPSDRQVSPHRLADLENVLQAARAVGIGVVPVLYAQSHGDCVLLPAWAVDRSRPRAGVRCLTEGYLTEGGPRDLYADTLMLEAADLWLRGLLDAFAGHPAIAAWDLGHDPATTVRPRRIADLARWVELMAQTLHGRGERAVLTLGAADVLTARGVRLAAVAPHLDGLGLALDPQRLGLSVAPRAPLAPSPVDAVDSGFCLALAQRLAAAVAPAPPITVVTGVAAAAPGDDEDASGTADAGAGGGEPPPPRWDLPLLDASAAVAQTDRLLGVLRERGAAGLTASSWCVLGERPLAAPPCDRRPTLARLGLADRHGELRASGEVWSRLAAGEPAAAAAQPWPGELDVEEYYAELPGSARDLLAAWRREGAPPAAG